MARLRPRERARRSGAVCVDNADCPASLELHKICRTLPDEDHLFPAAMFVAMEPPERVRFSRLRAAAPVGG